MSEEIVATPLLQPIEGTPELVDTEESFRDALEQLAKGFGPFAVDAERASGFRYSARAYLIQIKSQQSSEYGRSNSARKHSRFAVLA
jgi:ribonuclease D